MPRILIDFKCPKGHMTERLIDSSTQYVRCKTCGESAKRVISPVRSSLDPISGHFPDATAKWIKSHEEGAKSNN